MKLKVILLFTFLSASTNADVVICRGSHWAYKFEIDGSNCKHQKKVIKEIPMYKVGHISDAGKMRAIDCWSSSSKIQMDGAKCCVDGAADTANLNCKDKKMTF
jgi:hypothetical protein